jgi:hypothetical protein
VAAVKAPPPRRSATSIGPRVRVEPFTTERTSGDWTVTWRIKNEGDRPIHLLSAQHPHSQFRTPETKLDQDVSPGAETDVALPVRFNESPGAIVENPFLILVLREADDWRFLARVRVTAGKNGEPIADASVVVTVQKVEGQPRG